MMDAQAFRLVPLIPNHSSDVFPRRSAALSSILFKGHSDEKSSACHISLVRNGFPGNDSTVHSSELEFESERTDSRAARCTHQHLQRAERKRSQSLCRWHYYRFISGWRSHL
jgi:hypothetical protein